MANTNVSLVKVSEKIIANNEQLVTFRSEFREVANLIFPDAFNFGLSPAHKVTATVINVDTNVDKYGNNRDIYKTDSGTFALHLRTLNRIAQAAGLTVTDSRILERQVDERNQVTLISHQIKWKMKSVDGSTKEGVATGKYDYYNDLNTKSDGQVKSRRKHAEALAESNAITRAIGQAVAELPKSFTMDELKKPFIVPCIVEDKNAFLKDLPKETQLEFKKLMAAKNLGIMDQLYPASNGKAITEGPGITPPAAEPEAQKPNTNTPPAAEIQDATIITEATELTQADKNKILANEFREAPQSERTEKILNLCKLKGIKNPSGASVSAAQIEKKSVDEQIEYMSKLLNIPDLEEELPL